MRFFATLAAALLVAAPSFAQPANDHLAHATAVSSLPYTATGTTDGATLEEDEQSSSCGDSDGSLWWAFTPAEDGDYVVTTEGSDFDTVLSLWVGGGHPLTEIACNDDGGGGKVASELSGTLTGGATYYVRLSGLGGATGAFVVNAKQVVGAENDALAGATRIEALPYSVTGSNTGATLEDEEAVPNCGADGGSLWWAFTPAADGIYRASTFGSDFDTGLSLWTGSGHPLTEIGCNDDAGGGVQSAVSGHLTGGVTYYIRLHGYNGATGTFELTVESIEPSANNDLASATVVTTLPYEVSGSTEGASVEPNEAAPSCGSDRGSLWWAFTPSENRRVRFLAVRSDFDSVLSLWTGSDHPLAEQGCNVYGYPTEIVADLAAGTTYYLRLNSNDNVDGAFDLRIESFEPPPGDTRAASVVVEGALPQTLVAYTDPATEEPNEPSPACARGLITRSVWYRYTPTADGMLEVNAAAEWPFVQMSMSIYDGDTELASACDGFGERAVRGDAAQAFKPAGKPGLASPQGVQGVRMPIRAVSVTAGTTYDIRIATRDGGTIDVAFDGPAALPVELASFTATANGRAARLAWTTASETNNAGFVVERQTGQTWTDASALIAGHGTTTEQHVYTFDATNLTAGTHTFRLRQIDTDGAIHHSATATVEIGVEGEARVTLLGQRAVRVEVTTPQAVTVSVYDVLGRQVQRAQAEASGTIDVALPPGLAAGAYVVRVAGERFVETRTLVVR